MSEYSDPTLTGDVDPADGQQGFGSETDPGHDEQPYSIGTYHLDGSTEVVTDLDGDGFADLVQHDRDSDGVPETVYLDGDGDGRIDTISWDRDGDGATDRILRGTDHDGRPDQVEYHGPAANPYASA